MQFKKISFDESFHIWKTKLNLSSYKDEFLKKAKKIIDSKPTIKGDGYPYPMGVKNVFDNDSNEYFTISDTNEIFLSDTMDSIVKNTINIIKKINEEEKNVINWNMIHSDVWINRVRAQNPVQNKLYLEGDEKYHTHTFINEYRGIYFPHYTFVYYIQMPDIMHGDDGVLYVQNKNKDVFSIKPEEDDLIIMESWVPHTANTAPSSTIDRIVFAGNVGFESIKKEKTLF
jgi:hypothetical protein